MLLYVESCLPQTCSGLILVRACPFLLARASRQVKAVASAEAAAGRPLAEGEARELKDMAVRESRTLHQCFVAASATEDARPADGQPLPAGCVRDVITRRVF